MVKVKKSRKRLWSKIARSAASKALSKIITPEILTK